MLLSKKTIAIVFLTLDMVFIQNIMFAQFCVLWSSCKTLDSFLLAQLNYAQVNILFHNLIVVCLSIESIALSFQLLLYM